VLIHGDIERRGREQGREGGRGKAYQDELLVFLRSLVAREYPEFGDELAFILGLAFLLVLRGKEGKEGGKEGGREGGRVNVSARKHAHQDRREGGREGGREVFVVPAGPCSRSN